MLRKRLSIFLISLVSVSVVLSWADISVAKTKAAAQGDVHIVPLEDVQRFTNAITQIKSFYVKEVGDKEIFDDAIRGMLEGLDPHSTYLDPEDFKSLKSSTTGEFGGLGIEIDMHDGLVRVVTPLDDTPAYEAGMEAGDLIFKIDDTPIKGMKLKDAIKKMRGKRGEKVSLGVIRDGEKEPLTFDIVRDVIKVQSVKDHLLEPGYGYIRISNFQERTGADVKKAVAQLKKESKIPLKGIVLDLRNNPGGLLTTAVEVSDVFLDANKKLGHDNLIVYTSGRIAEAKYEAHATAGDALNGKPIVVLINGGSASGSEIVAGALQDHKRAVVLGKKSFGKGSVQTVLPLDDAHAIKLTTALYYTPAGRSIQAKGIEPDITVDALKIPEKKVDAFEILTVSEAQLTGRVDNPNQKKAAEKSKDSSKQKGGNKKSLRNHFPDNKDGKLLHKDFQMYQALMILKSMNKISKN